MSELNVISLVVVVKDLKVLQCSRDEVVKPNLSLLSLLVIAVLADPRLVLIKNLDSARPGPFKSGLETNQDQFRVLLEPL